MKASEYARANFAFDEKHSTRELGKVLNALSLKYIDETIREVKKLHAANSQVSKLRELNKHWQAIAREIEKQHPQNPAFGAFFVSAQCLYEKHVISFVDNDVYRAAFVPGHKLGDYQVNPAERANHYFSAMIGHEGSPSMSLYM